MTLGGAVYNLVILVQLFYIGALEGKRIVRVLKFIRSKITQLRIKPIHSDVEDDAI